MISEVLNRRLSVEGEPNVLSGIGTEIGLVLRELNRFARFKWG